jgi:hypothetical protein
MSDVHLIGNSAMVQSTTARIAPTVWAALMHSGRHPLRVGGARLMVDGFVQVAAGMAL